MSTRLLREISYAPYTVESVTKIYAFSHRQVSVSETERSLVDQEWFHGVLPREEVVRLLRADGDYLVRETTRNHARQLVLSVCWGQHKHFIVQTTPEVSTSFKIILFRV